MKPLVPVCLIILLILCVFFGQKYKLGNRFPKWKIIINVILLVLIIYSISTIFLDFGNNKKSNDWAIKLINYKGIHEFSKGSSQKIALIDTGISDFQYNKSERNIVLAGDEYDNNGHGTIIYSLIKGYENKVEGIAPEAEAFSIKVMDADESIRPNVIVEAIEKSIEEGCTIINLSLGSYKYNEEINKAIDKALAKKITVVSSSGDYATKEMLFPANKDGVISVGSSSANLNVSDFTNAPEECVIIAPGDEVKGINSEKEVCYTSGTSQATSLIAGYIALLKDYAINKNIDLTNEEIIMILKSINTGRYNYKEAFNEIK